MDATDRPVLLACLQRHAVTLAWVGLVFLAGAWFYNGANGNQISRFDALFSFVEPGTPDTLSFRINHFLADPKNGVNTIDWANNPRHDANFYSNKAPGPLLLGIPVYAALYGVERLAGLRPEAPWLTLWNCYLLNLLLTVLPVALSAPCFFQVLRSLQPAARWWPALLTAGLYFGTLLWPYSTQFWGHATAAAFSVIALWFLARNTPAGLAWAGFFIGWGVLTEYSVGITLVTFVLWLMLRQGWRPVLTFAAGGLLPLALFAAYHYVCFGGVLALSNFHNNPDFRTPGAMAELFTLARAREALWGLTFSPFRGLFYHLPLLLLVFPALGLAWRSRLWRLPFFWVCLANVGGFFIMNLTFNGWAGGSCVGPRYQIPALPFYVLLLGLAATTLGALARPLRTAAAGLAMALLLLSAANMFILCAVSPMAGLPELASSPQERQLWQTPLRFYYVSFANGFVQPYDLVPVRLEAEEPGTKNLRAFSLGEFLGLRGTATTLPLLALLFAGGVGLALRLRAEPPHTPGATAGRPPPSGDTPAGRTPAGRTPSGDTPAGRTLAAGPASGGSPAGRALTVLVVLAAAAALALNLAPGSRVRTSIRERLAPLFVAGQPGPFDRLDAIFTQTCPTGNLYLRFRGLNPADRREGGLLLLIYFRGSYLALPRRAYASTSNNRITNEFELAAANDEPAPAWLQAHGVRYVLTFDKASSEFPLPAVTEVGP